MVMIDSFDSRTVDPLGPSDAIPAGKYTAVIVESSQKENKKGTGSYLQLKFEIVEGEFKGKHLFARLNVDNPNETAVRIARAELSSICRAAGVEVIGDTEELHNLPLVIQVRTKKRNDSDEIDNEIKGYGPVASAPSQPSTSYQPPQGATGEAPWRR